MSSKTTYSLAETVNIETPAEPCQESVVPFPGVEKSAGLPIPEPRIMMLRPEIETLVVSLKLPARRLTSAAPRPVPDDTALVGAVIVMFPVRVPTMTYWPEGTLGVMEAA